MKQIMLFGATILLVISTMSNACSQTESATAQVLGVFVASTPCGKNSQPVPGIPANADCEFIKWRLTLYHDAASGAPTTYKLVCRWGPTLPNTTGFKGGGTPIELEGKWNISTGTATDPKATIYQLITRNKPILLLKLNNELLHLLDSDKHLMIGNPGWSFTLNKVNK